jgi:hypothetical protein
MKTSTLLSDVYFPNATEAKNKSRRPLLFHRSGSLGRLIVQRAKAEVTCEFREVNDRFKRKELEGLLKERAPTELSE